MKHIKCMLPWENYSKSKKSESTVITVRVTSIYEKSDMQVKCFVMN